MTRLLILILCTAILLPACSQGRTGQRTPPAKSGNSDVSASSSFGAAAAKVTDACTLAPTELVEKLVPRAFEPSREQFPKRCTFSNGKSALEITFDTGPDEPVKGAEFIAGLAKGGYLERLDPHSRGDVYLTVILGGDETVTNRNLHVEVAGHDGQDHKADAIDVARAVLSKLAG